MSLRNGYNFLLNSQFQFERNTRNSGICFSKNRGHNYMDVGVRITSGTVIETTINLKAKILRKSGYSRHPCRYELLPVIHHYSTHPWVSPYGQPMAVQIWSSRICLAGIRHSILLPAKLVALRAALCAFKTFPEGFVRMTTMRDRLTAKRGRLWQHMRLRMKALRGKSVLNLIVAGEQSVFYAI